MLNSYFKFNIGDIGTAAIPAQDTITDFNMSEGDSLDLSSILVDEENNDLTQYLSFDQADPANPIVEVRDTAGGDITQKITLQGVDLSLLGSTDAEIINSMLNSGNLSTD
ncbi:type I secretion C-terminal target domain-containing protein [Endozoicomonas sp.]|uniref:type I secretion C-terminal target domain-containing protein n=1 Tax=Endozoicomonas sp. TaxID=1892382 RepID=UPI003AF5C79B